MKQRVHQMLIFYRCGHLCNFMSSCDAIMNKYPAPRAKAGNLRGNTISSNWNMCKAKFSLKTWFEQTVQPVFTIVLTKNMDINLHIACSCVESIRTIFGLFVNSTYFKLEKIFWIGFRNIYAPLALVSTPHAQKSRFFYADCILASFFLFIHSNQWKFHLFFILNSNHHDCHLSLGNGTTQWCWHLNLSFWHLVTAAFFKDFFCTFFYTFNNRMKKKQVTITLNYSDI